MKARNLTLTVALLFAAGGAGTSRADIPIGGLNNLVFDGICHLDRGPGLWFKLPVGDHTTLAVEETDDYGNEVVTNILVSFGFGDALGALIETDLPPPQVGAVHGSDLQLGVRISAVLPSRLGDKILCSGSVIREEAE